MEAPATAIHTGASIMPTQVGGRTRDIRLIRLGSNCEKQDSGHDIPGIHCMDVKSVSAARAVAIVRGSPPSIRLGVGGGASVAVPCVRSNAARTTTHSARIWVAWTSSSQIGPFRMSQLLLRPASDREPQPNDKLFAARSSGTARKTLLATAMCLPKEFRANTTDRSRKCRS